MDSEILKLSLDKFVKIPKLELHAHLNGSLSQNTFQKLINLKKSNTNNNSVLDFSTVNLAAKDLSECFKVFALIHAVTDTPEAIYMATCDVIKDFHDDGVYYLELRTTPKAVSNYMTQESYVDIVLKAIYSTVDKLKSKMYVKLILSIDRKRPFCSAEETIKIAEKYYTSSQSVIGIDLSGDPTAGNIKTLIPLFEYGKRVGLKLALHVGEVPDVNEEVKKLLKLQPDRLGHGTFLHPSRGGSVENFTTLKDLKIPLEICLSSNVISKTVPSYEEHHFKLFKEMNYPCALCTDDKGIFNTCLSKEYYLASKYYSLSDSELCDLSYKIIDYAFSSSFEKQELKVLWALKRSQVV